MASLTNQCFYKSSPGGQGVFSPPVLFPPPQRNFGSFSKQFLHRASSLCRFFPDPSLAHWVRCKSLVPLCPHSPSDQGRTPTGFCPTLRAPGTAVWPHFLLQRTLSRTTWWSVFLAELCVIKTRPWTVGKNTLEGQACSICRFDLHVRSQRSFAAPPSPELAF